MSLTTSMNNALSGLAAASRGAQVVSSNVANATTEGYGLRVLELSARADTGAGQGVRIDGVTRVVDEGLIAEGRIASASSEEGDRLLAAAAEMVDIVGEPDQPGSLTQRVAAFESALSLAISRPDSTARLEDAVAAAGSLAQTFNRMTDETQAMRSDADANISDLVERLNTTLRNIDDLNDLILRAGALGEGVPALLDERQKQIDSIADILPIRQIERDNGAVALYTPSGTALLDITPAEFGFSPTATITADMTLASGALSGLTINDQPIDVSASGTAIAGGALAAEFAIRDSVVPEFQSRLDALAAELIVRFSDPVLDPSLNVGDPGVFTDQGGAFDPTDIAGLAGRLDINAGIHPGAGGEAWRLREGVGAIAETEPGNARLLDAISNRFSEALSPTVPIPGQGPAGFASMTDRLLAFASNALSSREQAAAFRGARLETLEDALRADGVNTDQEMQKLLLIERFYAANAKVIETVDEMLGLLTRI